MSEIPETILGLPVKVNPALDELGQTWERQAARDLYRDRAWTTDDVAFGASLDWRDEVMTVVGGSKLGTGRIITVQRLPLDLAEHLDDPTFRDQLAWLHWQHIAHAFTPALPPRHRPSSFWPHRRRRMAGK